MSLSTLVRWPLRWIKTLVPAALKQRYRNSREMARERRALAELPVARCDLSRLGRLDSSRLASFWKDPSITFGWLEDCPRVACLDLPHMTGGVNPGDQRALYHLVMGLGPRRVLEIGTHIGCSTVHLALALQRTANVAGQAARLSGQSSSLHLTTADIRDVNDPVRQPWKDYGSKHSPRQMLERLGLDAGARFEVADSLDYLQTGADTFDLIFLDGLHEATRVYQEVPLALKRLRPGGFLLLHDYFPEGRPLWSNGVILPGPFLAVQRFRAEGAAFRVLPLGALPWPTKLGSNRTSLALVCG